MKGNNKISKIIPLSVCTVMLLGNSVPLSADNFKPEASLSLNSAKNEIKKTDYTEITEKEVSEEAMYFNFSKTKKPGFVTVCKEDGSVPVYSDEVGYGFVLESCAMPKRSVDMSVIVQKSDAFTVKEGDKKRFELVDKNGNELAYTKCTTYNFGGMIFRVKAPAGGYKIEVETTGNSENTSVAISGMQPSRVNTNTFWDAAKLVPVQNKGEWNDNVFSFNYANGMPYIDIEIEPLKVNTEIGVKSIKVTPIEVYERKDGEKPTIYTVGDSTVKSYICEEAPMSGWGQVFDRLFDLEKVNVVNYSMGGRSMKSMYQEGRVNDILMTGKKGDYVFLQSGHNDERKGTDIGTADGENARFGGGSTEEMYKKFITDIYVPAIKARGMIPILVTPMTRINGDAKEGYIFEDSFTNRKFPQVMREAAKELGVTLIDLNKKSVEYANEIGAEGIKAIVMSIEPGETPGKTNSGSYANGHPSQKIDGTHMKEALTKQYARIVVQEAYDKFNEGDESLGNLISYIKEDVKSALESGDFSKVYPEVCADTIKGEGAYYRDQIEKLIQLGVMEKDENGNFNPERLVTVKEFNEDICEALSLDEDSLKALNEAYKDETLTRQVMACICYDAYNMKFTEKPAYMTNYNGKAISPDDPNYDSNLVGEEAQYYSMAGYGTIKDKNEILSQYKQKVKLAYDLGLIRAEKGVLRGVMANGSQIEPREKVTRAKAAKQLYFMWVLTRPINSETDWIY